MTDTINRLHQSDLGKSVTYSRDYDPSLLFPLARQNKRDELGINFPLPFTGFDLWNHYEVSWLNAKGKPIAAIAEMVYPCESPYIIESKSMKLYFNSFNQSVWDDLPTIQATMTRDLSQAVGMPVQLRLTDLCSASDQPLYAAMTGTCLDHLDITCTTYQVDPSMLITHPHMISESVFSHLLKSNCLITHQPDWGSVEIQYTGRQIDHVGLLQYIVSFREHNEFHEQCIERIFIDIWRYCQPQKLRVYGRYTRRGGLDINVLRTNDPAHLDEHNRRLLRQ